MTTGQVVRDHASGLAKQPLGLARLVRQTELVEGRSELAGSHAAAAAISTAVISTQT
jgi:hypothetical protein